MNWDREAVKDSIVQQEKHLFPFHIALFFPIHLFVIAIYHDSLCFCVNKMSFMIFDPNHLTYRNTQRESHTAHSSIIMHK